MKRNILFGSILMSALVTSALAVAEDTTKSPDPVVAGKRAFVDVARVLHSPRCQNCHPAGDAPLQTDRGVRHAMNVTRTSVDSGLVCNACHQERNSEAVGIAGGPPGAPKWGLPPPETPMVFQDRSLTALCEQLKDQARNGHKDFPALLEHVTRDPLVMWGFQPGGRRTKPPIDHAAFVSAFKTWTSSGGPCP